MKNSNQKSKIPRDSKKDDDDAKKGDNDDKYETHKKDQMSLNGNMTPQQELQHEISKIKLQLNLKQVV